MLKNAYHCIRANQLAALAGWLFQTRSWVVRGGQQATPASSTSSHCRRCQSGDAHARRKRGFRHCNGSFRFLSLLPLLFPPLLTSSIVTFAVFFHPATPIAVDVCVSSNLARRTFGLHPDVVLFLSHPYRRSACSVFSRSHRCSLLSFPFSSETAIASHCVFLLTLGRLD